MASKNKESESNSGNNKDGEDDSANFSRVGHAMVLLEPLSFLLNITEEVPVLSLVGKEIGKLKVGIFIESVNGSENLTPREPQDNQDTAGIEKGKDVKIGVSDQDGPSEDDWKAASFTSYEGKLLKVRIVVEKLSHLCVDPNVQIRYCFDPTKSTKVIQKCNPDGTAESQTTQVFNSEQIFSLNMNHSLQEWFSTEQINFEVWSSSRKLTPRKDDDGDDNGAKKVSNSIEAERDRLKKELEELKKKKATKSSVCTIS